VVVVLDGVTGDGTVSVRRGVPFCCVVCVIVVFIVGIL